MVCIISLDKNTRSDKFVGRLDDSGMLQGELRGLS